jgi:hypothetical protein
MPSAEAAPEPTTVDPSVANGQRLGELWCRDGFAWPDGPPPPCNAAKIQTSNRRTDGVLDSMVFELSVSAGGFSEAHYLRLSTGQTSAAMKLAEAWSSGVGGFSHEIAIRNLQVDDVYGDTTPEWFAEIEVEAHDSDMGLCRIQGSIERSLVLCTSAADGFACLRLPLEKLAYDEIEPSSEPSSKCAPPRVSRVGYAMEARVTRGFIELSAKSKTALEKPPTRKTKPPYRGKLSIAELLSRARADVVVL